MLSLLVVDDLSVDVTMGLFSDVIAVLEVWFPVVVVDSSVEVGESQLFIWLGSRQLSARLPFDEARK